ncbi:MAG: hypothetical protein KF866_02925 [Phycisphaeraceae bacterium]|nr:hypothetical protein [Phycisphaeraceae bacterium]MCW5753351.1 hypothetical protein [Phycisphaeraceae bacterium]
MPLDDSLAKGLAGDLRCLRCGYSQRGLSVRSECPECGTPVLATILAVVDPQAHELQPIRWRTLVSWGLLVWAGGAASAALLCWVQRIIELLVTFGHSLVVPRWIEPVDAGLIVVSGIGAIALINPHAGIPRRHILTAAGAVALYPALVVMHMTLASGEAPAGYLTPDGAPVRRAFLRLLHAALIVGIMLGLRPNLRLLAARSRLVRFGRVDRQSVLALVGALGIAALGDLIRLVTDPSGGLVRDAGALTHAFMVGVGSVLFTLGLLGVLRDSFRLAPVIRQPALGVQEVFSAPHATKGNPNPP